LLQREGIPVLLHGLSGAALVAMGEDGEGEQEEAPATAGAQAALRFGRVTTDEVLAALGILPAETGADACALLATSGLAYIATEALAPGAARVLALRARLGLRSSVHSLVKLIDPFGGAGFRVISVSHPDYVRRMRELMSDSRADGLLLRGTEGEPYANPRRRPLLERFSEGQVVETLPAEEGTIANLPDMPRSNDASVTAGWIRRVLDGQITVPEPIAAQVAMCARGARREA
jgi:anthranilate phosphoribosyltransferase